METWWIPPSNRDLILTGLRKLGVQHQTGDVQNGWTEVQAEDRPLAKNLIEGYGGKLKP